MKVYSIVVTYNGQLWIEKCLLSLRNSSLQTKVIVIDNKSIDGTISIIEEHFPEVELIRLPSNTGFAHAGNIGMKEAISKQADYVFLLNQDAWIENNTLDTLVELNRKHPQYSIISPIHLSGDGDQLDFNFSLYIKPTQHNTFYSDLYFGKTQEIYPVDFINAAAWLISIDCIKKIGLFSSIFFHYGEDEDYCNRLRYHQLKIGFTPLSKILHDRANRLPINPAVSSLIGYRRARVILLLDVNRKFYHVYNMIALRSLFQIIKCLFLLKFERLKINIDDFLYFLLNWKLFLRIREKNKITSEKS